MNNREETKYNLLLWKTKDNSYVFLEEAFRYTDWTKLQWLTYNEMAFYTQAEVDDRNEQYFNDSDTYKCWYVEYLKYHEPRDMSYNDWQDLVLSETETPSLDDSYRYKDWCEQALDYIKEREEDPDLEWSDCLWWGRVWSESHIMHEENYEWIMPENWKLFKKLLSEYEWVNDAPTN